MGRANEPEVPSTSGKRSDRREERAFGAEIARGRPNQRPKQRTEPQRDRRPGAFSKRRDFQHDSDLTWFFQRVGKGGQKRLRSPHDLRRWSRLNQALGGLWRLCQYFTNPRQFARPLVAALVDDVSDYGAGARHLYGLRPHEREALFRKEEKELESRKFYAMPVRRDLDPSELAGLVILEKDYTEYMRRVATNARRPPEVIVSIEVLHRLVRPQFEHRRTGEYPTVDTTTNVIGECWRFGDITWSTWQDYAVNPHAARTILHKRRVPGVEGLSDLQLIKKLEAVVAEEARQLEADEAAEAEARANKAARAQRARRKPILDWFSSTLALDLSVAEIARAAKLPQREVRQRLMDQGCPGVTLAEGEPNERWLNNSDAGRAFKDALAAAIRGRRRAG